MAALSAARMTDERGGAATLKRWKIPLKASTKVYAGSLCAIDTGFLVPWSAATGLKKAGRACATYDNSAGADGAVIGEVEQGCFGWDIGASADALAQADVGNTVYGLDDHTVGKTDGTGTRSACGVLMEIENSQAFVSTVTS